MGGELAAVALLSPLVVAVLSSLSSSSFLPAQLLFYFRDLCHRQSTLIDNRHLILRGTMF